ncbi:hypothetical protein [Salisaeta longa]|uniref:hypothetical protein n=1 Tax=Salisaeta longa TaxID=503170 RepID=UPI0003B74DEB|nr:hypothetical protein [Salisaeta longa]
MQRVVSDEPLLVSPCDVPNQSLFWGRAYLYSDRIIITGWTWRGRYRECVALDRVESTRWWGGLDDVNFMLRLQNDRRVPLQLKRSAGRWHCCVSDLLDHDVLASPALPSPTPPPNMNRAA